MSLRPELVAAYKKALYVVYGAPDLVIRIGERNEELDALLEADGLDTAAYLTAANPGGELQGKTENELSCAALHQGLADAGYLCYLGEGRDPEGGWPAEPSILALGISRYEAMVIGRSYEQNAIVFIELGKPPELVAL
jgi:Protein of unknown function (DUF3293)